ncbi:class I SAM-dependent methyltransferase [Phormidium sp. FACHB-322]|uniref:class I SAM-dependent methyltransferase n=1 Tax=Phormidium sp. FACHB-322 TaxID=2692849 RepID=UPI001683DAFD|nr:methyltransferase domain-containing protein [Phormidium sp. FACHB-322]MBD1914324.1 class I SAM-dependent methyltransferase [Phormidium sp. FACHB-77]MBD2028456.1 class I SAM-dependent methyltransferase [Phormidium sp. FACHB-322]MBD2053614.1 class I SAM-dependent methyltransferase [Leptolyngbya sp. FACHB-60]
MEQVLDNKKQIKLVDGLWTCWFENTPSIQANSLYFSHPKWAKTYFDACHRDALFKERWQAAAGSWTGKIVVDVGCGPGNLLANLGGTPKLLIGIDIAPGSLAMAKAIGYIPLLADAHNIPLVSGFADLVVVNAALHHCDDMPKVLSEAARLVRPGGLLVVDHDPQLTGWHYRGLGLLLYKLRLGFIYRFFLRDLYIPDEERLSALATEVHHQPGHGVTRDLFLDTLVPLGFEVKLYPHNNAIGAEALQGQSGKPPHWRYRIGQLLSGINCWSADAALTLMCVATRRAADSETTLCSRPTT